MERDTEFPGLVEQPRGSMPEIQSIWAFVSVDPKDDNEGILSIPMGRIQVPLIASDKVRLDQLRVVAEHMAKLYKIKVKMVRFITREVVEEFNYEEKKEETTSDVQSGDGGPESGNYTGL